jgi:hypothetical protein
MYQPSLTLESEASMELELAGETGVLGEMSADFQQETRRYIPNNIRFMSLLGEE